MSNAYEEGNDGEISDCVCELFYQMHFRAKFIVFFIQRTKGLYKSINVVVDFVYERCVSVCVCFMLDQLVYSLD